MPFYWGVILGWGEPKVNCYLVDLHTSRQLAGEFGETEWFPLGIGSLKFWLSWGLGV